MSTVTISTAALTEQLIGDIQTQSSRYIRISHDLNDHPELGNEEYYALGLLTQVLRDEGFSIETDIAGHPTGFIARKKAPNAMGPVLGFLAEYDALPEIGHGCGHNIIGTASVAAAITVAKVLAETGGEIVVFGSPAEEGGTNGSAKASYVKQGLFKEIDACLMVHPANLTATTERTLALDPIDFEFKGKPAHAAACPENGINALDGVIQLFNGINALRQHLPTDVRIHGIITHGGDAPNIVPAYAKARFFVRAGTRARCNEVTQKVIAIAHGAALATGSEVAISYFQNPVDDFLINRNFNTLFKEVMEQLGADILTNSGRNMGSTDAGNVSQVVPTIQPFIRIGPDDLVAHSVEFANAAKSKAGDHGLLVSIQALAITGLILLTDPHRLQAIKDEFALQRSE